MPQIFKSWGQAPGTIEAPTDIVSRYERGEAGALYSREETERFRAEMPNPDGEDICHAFGYADSAAGKLVTPWVGVEATYPGCWPASPQRIGDCVSHNLRNQMLTTHVGELLAGIPDEVSGKVEDRVDVSPEGLRDGVFATEPAYRHRGHRSHGWYCPAACRIAVQVTGCVVRKDYPGVKDLTRYDSRWATALATSEERDTFDDNRFREATELNSFEAIRDMLDRGFGVGSCGSEGFAKTRNEDGVARQTGRWAHAMAYVGADDRDDTKAKYGGPLVLVLNSWGRSWIKGERRVRGTSLMIPEGSFWAKWSDLRRRNTIALSGLNGWARRSLPDYLGGW